MQEHRLVYRVPYADVDRMGVVYYAHYFVYFERGRTEFLRTYARPYLELEGQGLYLPVVEAVCRYHKPAHYDDELVIITRMPEVTGARIKMACEIWRGTDKLAEGYTWHATVTREGKPCRVPRELVALVCS